MFAAKGGSESAKTRRMNAVKKNFSSKSTLGFYDSREAVGR